MALFLNLLAVFCRTHVDELSEEDLVRILTEPKNALVRQYQKLMAMDGVSLSFTDDALRAVAKRAIERKTGARGLRNVLESVMLDIMYELPTATDIQECVINEGVVTEGLAPMMVWRRGKSCFLDSVVNLPFRLSLCPISFVFGHVGRLRSLTQNSLSLI